MIKVALLIAVILLVRHAAHSEQVHSWQERQHQRISCSVSVLQDREDLTDKYCRGE